jgi:rod shape-determining protein MreD
MLRKTTLFILIFIAAVLQISFFPNVFPSGCVPDAVLILIIIWVFQEGFEKNWLKIIFAGFMLDLFFFWPIGVNIISFLVVAFGIGFLTKRFRISHKNTGFFVMVVLIAAGTIVNSLVLNLLITAFNSIDPDKIHNLILNFWDKRMAFKILSNLLLFSIIFWPMIHLERFLSLYDSRSLSGRFFK